MIPILVALLMYFDLKLEICAGVLNMVCCILNGVYSVHVLGTNSLSETNMIFVICSIIIQHNHLPGVPRGRPAQHRGARRTGSPQEKAGGYDEFHRDRRHIRQ